MTDTEKDMDAKAKGEARGIHAGENAAAGTTRVAVEGEPIDANVAYPARTPRDVAIQRTKAGEDVGLESSLPDRSEPITLPSRVRGAKEFVDASGQKWTRGEVVETKVPLLDPDAIRKDGGDPGILNIPPNRSGERYAVPNASNESYSPEGVLDTETGAVREKTVEEGGVEASDERVAEVAPDPVKMRGEGGGRAARLEAKGKAAEKAKTARASEVKSGRGGSSAKARSQARNRGGAKRKAARAKK